MSAAYRQPPGWMKVWSVAEAKSTLGNEQGSKAATAGQIIPVQSPMIPKKSSVMVATQNCSIEIR